MPEPASNVVELKIIHGGGGGPGGGGGAGPEDGSPATVFASEDDLALRLVAHFGDDWRCAAGDWYRWDGARWEHEQTKLAQESSRRLSRALARGIDSQALARNVASRRSATNAVALAEGDRRVAIIMEDFDRHPWLLNTPDGVLNLKTGQLEPHDRALLMTKIAGAGPLDGGDCPTFMRYLDEATGGDRDLQRYLQRVAGYCLTGSIEEHCILFFHGPGGSGKSTFLLVLQDLLGDYAVNSPMNAFTVSIGERHPTEFAHFFGARVVTASEVEEGMRWDEAKLKAISGGDRITARYMRSDFFTFEPQFKLILAGNHRPRMRSADDAMRRRMQVVPFRQKPALVDKTLREKLRGELGAILRWAAEGEADRRRLGGLNPPRAVVDATNEYFQQENTLGRWIDERCEVPEGEDPARDYWGETRVLYRDFVDWARRVGEFAIPERSFSQKLEQMPRIMKASHPRTRRAGFAGVRVRFATPDLPGLDDPRDAAPQVLRINELPLEPIDDPADRFDR